MTSKRALSNNLSTVQKVQKKTYQRTRPNYFLSIRLNTQNIQDNFMEFSNHVKNNFPGYTKLLIDPVQIHITLFVFHIENEERLKSAKECLSNSQNILKEISPNGGPTISFKGIEIFNKGRVVYASPKKDDQLSLITQIADALHKSFKQNKLVGDDDDFDKDNYQPHATLMKLRNAFFTLESNDGKKQKIKTIPDELKSLTSTNEIFPPSTNANTIFEFSSLLKSFSRFFKFGGFSESELFS
ncbi:93_t:CDS:2 [Entrophospora sp. SA101]|nr:93_t:CDS:2 [Entrophospora sp. SA101]